MLTSIPFVVMVVGLLVFLISNHGKIQAVGKDMFWTALLVLLYMWSK